MRILVIGQRGTYPARGYAGIMHGSHVRPLALARAMARNGHRVSLLDQDGYGEVNPIEMRHLIRVGVVASFDAVVVVGISGLWRVREEPLLHEAVKRHPAAALVVDTIYAGEDAPEALGWARLVAASSSTVATTYRARLGAERAAYVPWCCTDDAPAAPNPWPNCEHRLLFVGVIHPRYLEVLNTLANRLPCEVWVAGVFRLPGVGVGLTQEQRSKLLSPRLRLATDAVGAGELGEGPVPYESAMAMMRSARLGLNLTPAQGRADMGVSCKLYDYAAAGLPVVSEPSPASDGDVAALRLGRVVPWGDVEAMERAVREEMAAPLAQSERDAQRAHAVTRLSWRDAARLLVSYMER